MMSSINFFNEKSLDHPLIKSLSRNNSIHQNNLIFNGKVVPKSSESIPSSAWGSKSSSCILINNKTDNLLQSKQSLDEAQIAFTNLKNQSNFSQSSDVPLLYSSESHRASCNYIELPDNEDKNEKYISTYKYITPSSTTDPSISDDFSNDETVNRVERKVQCKNPRFKFLCPPYFILVVSLMEIFVYIWSDDVTNRKLMYSPYERQQVWRFLSYMLLHSNVLHLTLNIIIQTFLATLLEFEQGWWRCAFVYIGGGIAGALGASVLQPNLYMVGASAGVYALLVSHVSNVIVKYSKLKYKIYRLISVAVLAGSDIAFSIAHCYYPLSGQYSPIGWGAHFAGAVSGLLLGLLVYKGCDRKNTNVRIAIWISLVLLLCGVTLSIMLNIFYIKIVA